MKNPNSTSKQPLPAFKAAKLTAAALLLSLLAAPSFAGHNRDFTAYAKVVDAEPIYQTVEYDNPERRCWTEKVATRRPQHASGTGTILGGLIGAAIGNELGHKKSNKRVGAVAGAVLGATIGSDISRRNRSSGTQVTYEDQQHCEVTHRIRKEEELVGYNVTYKYHGQTYQTRTTEHPGKKLKIAVNVRPAH
jgi:uncharacterized protein YcfJ